MKRTRKEYKRLHMKMWNKVIKLIRETKGRLSCIEHYKRVAVKSIVSLDDWLNMRADCFGCHWANFKYVRGRGTCMRCLFDIDGDEMGCLDGLYALMESACKCNVKKSAIHYAKKIRDFPVKGLDNV